MMTRTCNLVPVICLTSYDSHGEKTVYQTQIVLQCAPGKVNNIWTCALEARSGADPERGGKLHGRFSCFMLRVE